MNKNAIMAAAITPLLLTAPCSLMAQAAIPELPAGSYQVGFYDLRGEKDGNAAPFIATLGAAPGIEATAARGGGAVRSWRAIPPGVQPDKWITLARMHSGRQHDFLAFCFADAEGTIAFAARRPSRERAEPPMYPYTVAPGEWQLPMNAVREPATDILYRFREDNALPRPLLRIVAGGDAAGKVTIEDGVERANIDVTEALAFAAAYAAGWRPTAAAGAPQTLHIAMTEVRQVTFDVTCGFADGKPGVVRRNIPREMLYDHLVAVFLRLREPQAVVDAMPYGAANAEAIAWNNGRLFVKGADAGLKISNPADGNPPQAAGGAAGGKMKFTAQRDTKGALRFFSMENGISLVDPATAALTQLLKADTKALDGFAMADDGRLATVANGALAIFTNGKEEWQCPDAKGPPLWAGGLVIVSGADGAVRVLDTANRQELWRSAATAGERRMAVCGDLLLLHDTTSITAFDLRQGKQMWQAATGDKLIVAPVRTGDDIFVAMAPGVLQILNSRDGAVRATRNWPTWIIAVQACSTAGGWRLACLDLRNRLIQLNPQTLATISEVRLPRKLKPLLEYGDAVPNGWAPAASDDTTEELAPDILRNIHSETTRTAAAWLTADESGAIYAIAASATP